MSAMFYRENGIFMVLYWLLLLQQSDGTEHVFVGSSFFMQRQLVCA